MLANQLENRSVFLFLVIILKSLWSLQNLGPSISPAKSDFFLVVPQPSKFLETIFCNKWNLVYIFAVYSFLGYFSFFFIPHISHWFPSTLCFLAALFIWVYEILFQKSKISNHFSKLHLVVSWRRPTDI